MKNKLLKLLFVLLLCIAVFAACTAEEENNGTTNEPPSVEASGSVIYSSDTTLGIRYGDEVHACQEVSSLYYDLLSVTSVVKLDKDSDPMEHEIIIGVSDLDISTEAYRRLANIKLTTEQENSSSGYTKCLIYSDGRSVAIAFDENVDYISLKVAIDYAKNNLISDSLTLKAGTVFSAVTDIYEYYKAEDEILLDQKWALLATTIGDEGKVVTEALKRLYTIYSDDLISWMANLYEPDICVCEGECKKTFNCIGAGFYYSNSARNTVGYLPDLESTKQIFGILDKSGMTDNYAEDLPADMMNEIVRWVKSLQSAEDGYFYHPQWGTSITSSRRNRDLNSAVSILQAAGARPTYKTPTGIAGDGVVPTASPLTVRFNNSTASAVSKVVMTASATDSNLENKESFIAYLESLDVKNNSYVAGNTLAAYSSVIKARDRELAATGADYSLFDIMIEHLNNAQNPEDGTWYWVDKNSSSYSLYTAVNGLMKISCVYEESDVMMPNADKALQTAMKAITYDKDVSACVDVYNTWFAISNVLKIYKNVGGADNLNKIAEARALLIKNASSLISATSVKLASFLKPDGSFSYNVKYSAYESQGALAAVPKTEEGDVNATSICTTGTVALIYSCLGIDEYAVPIYTNSDLYRFVSIISELSQVIKDELETSISVDNADNHGKGKYKDLALDFEKTTAKKLLEEGVIGTDKPNELAFDTPTARNNIGIYDAEIEEPISKVLSFKKADSGDPYLYIKAQNTDYRSYVFEADICLLGGKTGFEDDAVFNFYFNNGDTIWSGFTKKLTQTKEYDEENREIYGTGVEDFDISTRVWYNFRIELQDIGTVGSEARFYINNQLVERKKITKTIDTLTQMALRFRYDSGAQSTMLIDNLYFSAVENLEPDNTPLIPPIDIQEITNAKDIDSENRGSGVYYQNAINYADKNASLLEHEGYIGTNGLYFDIKKTEEKNYAKVVSINGDAALSLGKNNGLGDPWLRILQTEKRSGSSYVFETDFVLTSGSEWRSGDNNLFSIYLSQNNTDSIFWGGASAQITLTNGEYRLVFRGTDTNGRANEAKIDTSKWYNFRIEIDGLAKGSLVKYYLNGELLFSAKNTEPASAASHMLLRFNVDAIGQTYLDNTYFAATGEIITEDPDAPEEQKPVLPDYERGGGVQSGNSGTLTFAGVTATELGNKGKISVHTSATLDGEKMSVSVTDVDGDAALKLHNNDYSAQGYFNIKADSVGKKYVFETDMMVASGSSQRGGRELMQIFSSVLDAGGENFASCGLPGIRIKAIPENGTTTYAVTNGNDILATIKLGEWFNIRYEFDDWSATGTEIRVYLNGVLALKTVTLKTTNSFKYIRLWMPPDSTSVVYLDNTYFSAVTEPFPDEPDAPSEGGDVEIKPSAPEDTVKDAANILPTKTGANGIVVLMHDDASSSVYIMDEVFREFGLCGNIAMYASGAIYTNGALDWSKVAKWQGYLDTGRWQLSSHSMTHTFPGLNDDEGKITYEVVSSQQILREAFPSQRILTYAYPGYYAQLSEYGTDRFSAIMRELVDTYYIAGRDSYGNANISLSDTNIDWKFSPSYQFDESNVSEILDAISKTQNGEMAVLFTHMIAANNDTLSSNTMYEKNLRIICEAVAKLRDEGKVWVAFYEDAVLYTREAQAATVSTASDANSITVTLTHTLDKDIYNYPLTVRVVTPDTWEAVKITRGDKVSYAVVKTVAGKRCIDASIVPNAENAVITPISIEDIPTEDDDTSLSANRGTGVYAASALNFTDVTASGLKENGKLGADSVVNLDAVAMGVIVTPEDGDNALKIGNAYGKVGYVYLNSHTGPGKNYVFETDLKFDSGSTTRSDNVIFQIYASTTKNSVSAYGPICFKIIRVDGIYYLNLTTKNSMGNATNILLETEFWYNLRIEMDDVTAGGDVRYYVNGTLVHTGVTTSKASELGSVAIWMPQDTSGIIELDNTFFGALDPNDDSTEEPELPDYERGSGAQAGNSSTLTFADTTLTTLKDNGSFVLGSGSASIDGSSAKNATIVSFGDDNALKLSNTASSSSAAYYAIKSVNGTSGGDYVFETDIYLVSATSTRGNNAFLAFADANVVGSSANYTPTVLFTVVDGRYQIMVNGTSVATDIDVGRWFNFRVEYDDCGTKNAEIRYYVNGELIGTSANKGATTVFGYVRVGLLDNSTSEVYLDNTYFGTQSK